MTTKNVIIPNPKGNHIYQLFNAVLIWSSSFELSSSSGLTVFVTFFDLSVFVSSIDLSVFDSYFTILSFFVTSLLAESLFLSILGFGSIHVIQNSWVKLVGLSFNCFCSVDNL